MLYCIDTYYNTQKHLPISPNNPLTNQSQPQFQTKTPKPPPSPPPHTNIPYQALPYPLPSGLHLHITKLFSLLNSHYYNIDILIPRIDLIKH